MSKLVFFLVTFATSGFWKIVIHTKASECDSTLMPGEHISTEDNNTSVLCSIYTCMYFDSMGGQIYLVVYDKRANYTVWIANRDKPIPNTAAAALTLDTSGALQITQKDNLQQIFLLLHARHRPQDINITEATLLDSGNFVIQQRYLNGSKSLLWQSFDYPTDVLLPGMKLGVNYKAGGTTWSLVSYFLPDVPALGAFTLEWDPKIKQLVIRKKGQIYWASGQLRNNNTFENIPEEAQRMYEYFIVHNEDEDSITFRARNDQYYAPWRLNSDGALLDSLGNDIARADECSYGNNLGRGCQLEDMPFCRLSMNSNFESRNVTADHLNKSADAGVNFTVSDCKDACWSNCNCLGFTSLYDNGTGCYFIYQETLVNVHYGGSDIFYMLDRTPSFLIPGPSSNQKDTVTKWNRLKWIIPFISVAFFIVCGLILCLVRKRRRLMFEVEKKGTGTEHTIFQLINSYGAEDANENRDPIKHAHDLRLFSYASTMEATNGFSSMNKLGEGGYGPVYKGVLMQKEVAIKRLSSRSQQGVAEFKNELRLESKLQHMNVVQLLGCCIHEDERLLIYEYMPNKSLDFFLFDSTRSKSLDWKKRLNIIEGITQGLLYLHKYSRLRIVHRDLKASNILLDEDMNPKISDFGMARIFMQESEVKTTRIVGTYGYMPPEYVMNGAFSRKSDVYSFGVLMLEIVSGRRNNSFDNTSYPINLVGHAWELWKEGQALKLMDPTLYDSFVEDQVLRCIHIGLLCVEECPVDRPTMLEILSMLTKTNEILPLHKRPAFYFGKRVNEVNESPKHRRNDSINDMSISSISAR